MNRFGELFGAFEAGIVQRLALKDAEPDLHLVEPARAGRREAKGDVRMGCQPVLVFLWVWLTTIILADTTADQVDQIDRYSRRCDRLVRCDGHKLQAATRSPTLRRRGVCF